LKKVEANTSTNDEVIKRMKVKRKLLITFGLTAIIAISIAIGAYAASDIKLFINGKAIATDIQIIKGSSYVPLKVVSESLGANVV
jgi:hypothetical protein